MVMQSSFDAYCVIQFELDCPLMSEAVVLSMLCVCALKIAEAQY